MMTLGNATIALITPKRQTLKELNVSHTPQFLIVGFSQLINTARVAKLIIGYQSTKRPAL